MTDALFEPAAGNAEMAAAWDGPEGAHWAEHAEHYEATGPAYDAALLGAVELRDDSTALDVGCGTGALTRALGRRVREGSVLGVDLSARMLDVGRRAAAAEGLDHVRFVQGDAQVFPFAPATFDTAFSSFGAMFFADPVAAFANIRGALLPGAPMVLVAWRDLDRNEWIREFRHALAAGRDLPTPPPGVPSPFSLADREMTTDRLADAGFVDVTLSSVDEPVTFGRDLEDAWQFVSTIGMARGLTADLDEPTRKAALDRLRRTLEEHETAAGVCFGGSAWLITARSPS
jgi:SAM-dependent methyltransferase